MFLLESLYISGIRVPKPDDIYAYVRSREICFRSKSPCARVEATRSPYLYIEDIVMIAL